MKASGDHCQLSGTFISYWGQKAGCERVNDVMQSQIEVKKRSAGMHAEKSSVSLSFNVETWEKLGIQRCLLTVSVHYKSKMA